MKFVACWVVCLVLVLCNTAAAAPIILSTQTPPVIDGKGDDSCWASAAEFRLDNPGPGITKLSASTTVKITFDSNRMYFLVKCNEPDTSRLVKNCQGYDSPIDNDDRVVFYLAAAKLYPERCYWIGLSPGGGMADSVAADKSVYAPGPVYKADGHYWLTDGKSSAVVSDGSWTAEASIALSAFGYYPWTDDTISMNIVRTRNPVPEVSSWAEADDPTDIKSFKQVKFHSITDTKGITDAMKGFASSRAKEFSEKANILKQDIPKSPKSSEMGSLSTYLKNSSAAMGSQDLKQASEACAYFEKNIDAMVSKAVVSESLKGSFNLVAVSNMRKYRSTELPIVGKKDVQLFAAKGEGESAQIILRTAKDISIASVSVGPFKGPKGYIIKPELYLAYYLNIAYPNLWGYFISGLYPDPLIEPKAFSVEAGRSQSIWLDVYVPRDAPTGKYSGNVTVTAGKEKRTMRVSLNVCNVTIPVTPYLNTHVWFLIRHATPTVSAEDYNADCIKGLKYRFTSPPKLPWDKTLIKGADGKWAADWSLFDKEVEKYLKLGSTCFRLDFIGWAADEPQGEQQEEYRTKLKIVSEHLRAMGWMDRFLFYHFDEVPVEKAAGITRFCDFIKAVDPGYQILGTVYPGTYPQMTGRVNIWCPHITDFNPQFMTERKRSGDKSWIYTCMGTGPSQFPDPWKIDWRGTGASAMVWWMWSQGVQGYLYWAVDCYWSDPWVSHAINTGFNGDGFMFYNASDPEQRSKDWLAPVVPSIRLCEQRDAFEDYDLLYMLDSYLKKHPELSKVYAYLLDTTSSATKERGCYKDTPELYSKRHDDLVKALAQIVVK